MRKSIAVIGCVLFLAAAVSACGNNSGDTKAETTVKATEESKETTKAAETTAKAAAGETSDELGTVEGEACATVGELNEKLGFKALELPESFGLEPSVLQYIDLEDKRGYLGYVKTLDTKSVYIDVYTVEGTDTASVMEGDITLTERDVNGTAVLAGEGVEMFQGIRGAKWDDGTLSYETVSFGQSEEEFTAMLEQLVEMTKE